MGKKDIYYFIARDIKTNKFKILSFGQSLEEIDLYTIKYQNKEELLKFLITKGKITSMDTDIYIGIPKKNENGEYVINSFDILYSDSTSIKDLANGSLNKKMPATLVDDVLNNFISNMKYSESYYSMVKDGKTSIFPKFINYFREVPIDNYYQIKNKDGAWPRKSYPLIRNIYDANSKFHNMDVYNMVSKNVIGRKLIEKQLLIKINSMKKGQKSLFDYAEFDNGRNDKLIEITNTFDSIDKRIFKFVDRKVILDTSKFNNISGEDLGNLKDLLNQDLMTVLYHYYNHRNFIYSDRNDNSSTYDKLIEEDQKKILGLLKNKNIFDNAYSWIMIYNKYMLGEEYGKQKRKWE